MSIYHTIKSFFAKDTRAAGYNPTAWEYTWFGAPTNSGITINRETALAHAGVWACCKVLAESLASLPIGLFQNQNGVIGELTNDTRHRLLSSEPSPLYNSYDFFTTGMLHVCTDGNFYALIGRDGNNRPNKLTIVQNPGGVLIELDPNGELWYKIPGIALPVRPKDIIHIKNISYDGLKGKSPITVFRENIGLGIATTRTQGSLWKNSTLMSGYLKHPGKLQPDQAETLKKTWHERYAGSENAGKTPVLENGLEFIPLTLKPQDAMFIETARLSLLDVCRMYRVPPHKIGELERSTNNNIEHQSLEFYRDTMRPHMKAWEQELNRKLLFDSEKTRLYFRFNADAILRSDTQSRGEYFTRALGSVSTPGWMTPNEVRGHENLNPIEGGDDIYNPSKNTTPDTSGNTNTDTSGDTTTDNGSNTTGEPGANN